MPTLSIIKSENKYAFTYSAEEDELTPMLTQCGLRDELLAMAIIKSAVIINRTMLEHRLKKIGLEEQTKETE